MTNHEFYFFQISTDILIRDYERVNELLRQQKALLRVGPAFDEKEEPIWLQEYDSNPTGIYRRREDFSNPLDARISLAEAYLLEQEARRNHLVLSPREPRLPGE